MFQSNNNNDTAVVETRRFKVWQRMTAQFMVFSMMFSTVATASTLSQTPPFTPEEPVPNVFLMLDDSLSMLERNLPKPDTIGSTPDSDFDAWIWQYVGSTPTWVQTTTTRPREYVWERRTPAINPIWYNPAIKYKPWNFDGKTVADGGFPDADIGGSNHGHYSVDADDEFITQRDMRFHPDGSGRRLFDLYVDGRFVPNRGTIGWVSGNLFREVDIGGGYEVAYKRGYGEWGRGYHGTGVDLFARAKDRYIGECPVSDRRYTQRDCSGHEHTVTSSALLPGGGSTLYCGWNVPTGCHDGHGCRDDRRDRQADYTWFENPNPTTPTTRESWQAYVDSPAFEAAHIDTLPVSSPLRAQYDSWKTSNGGYRLACPAMRVHQSCLYKCYTQTTGDMAPTHVDCESCWTPISHSRRVFDPLDSTYDAGAAAAACLAQDPDPDDAVIPSYTTYQLTPSQVRFSSWDIHRPNEPVSTGCASASLPQEYLPRPHYLTPARYFYYKGSGDKRLGSSYELVQIDRHAPNHADSGPGGRYDTLRAAATDQANIPHLGRYPIIDAVTGQTHDRFKQARNCVNYDWCTWEEEAQNFANWYAYYRNRLFSTIAVMSEVASGLETDAFRVGYGRLNYNTQSPDPWTGTTLTSLPDVDGFANPGAIVRGVRPFGGSGREEFFEWLFSLNSSGVTPNREAVDSVGRYFAYNDTDLGPMADSPGVVGSENGDNSSCRRNYLFLATDGFWTNKSGGRQLLVENLAADPLGGSVSTSTILNADDELGETITQGATSYQYDPTASSLSDSTTNTLADVAMYYWANDLRPDMPNYVSPVSDPNRPNPAFWQHMTTSVIGFGIQSDLDDGDAATVGTTRYNAFNNQPISWPAISTDENNFDNRIDDTFHAALNSRGEFYSATDVEALKDAVLDAFKEVTSYTGSAGGVTSTGPVLSSSDTTFVPTYKTKSWVGSLRGYAATDTAWTTSIWAPTLPDWDDRHLYTSKAKTTGVPFVSGSLALWQRALLRSSALSANANSIMQYIAGRRDSEQPAGNMRARESLIADIVNSAPLYSKSPAFGHSSDPHYQTYLSQKIQHRAAALYVGANGGVFHVFAADDITSGEGSGTLFEAQDDFARGEEIFGYIPRGLHHSLKRLAEPDYVHQYYVDGPIVQGDVKIGSTNTAADWRNIVIASTGAGGAGNANGGSVFALDVTNPTDFDAGKVLWDITKYDSASVGHIMSKGVIGRIKTGPTSHKWVYIVGNGPESRDGKAALLVIDISEGSNNGNITAIDVGTSTDNALGGVGVVYGPNHVIEQVYAGDELGNLWKFDFSEGVPSDARGFGSTAASPDGEPLMTTVNNRPITAAPRAVLHPRGGHYIVFGTGKIYDVHDLADASPELNATNHLYGLWDNVGATTKVDNTELAEISFTTDASDTRRFDISNMDFTTKRGWYVALENAGVGGERIINSPAVGFGYVVMNSYTPISADEAACLATEGSSYIYVINTHTGEVTGSSHSGSVGEILLYAQDVTTAANEQMAIGKDTLRDVLKGHSGSDSVTASSRDCSALLPGLQGNPVLISQSCPQLMLRAWRRPLE